LLSTAGNKLNQKYFIQNIFTRAISIFSDNNLLLQAFINFEAYYDSTDKLREVIKSLLKNYQNEPSIMESLCANRNGEQLYFCGSKDL